jgi:hypothetical protein
LNNGIILKKKIPLPPPPLAVAVAATVIIIYNILTIVKVKLSQF